MNATLWFLLGFFVGFIATVAATICYAAGSLAEDTARQEMEGDIQFIEFTKKLWEEEAIHYFEPGKEAN